MSLVEVVVSFPEGARGVAYLNLSEFVAIIHRKVLLCIILQFEVIFELALKSVKVTAFI